MLSFNQYFQEAISDFIPKLYQKLTTDPKLQGNNVWIHFSNIPKLGVNPNAFHRDPLGIYLFPKSYILDNSIAKNGSFLSMPYIFIVSINPNARMLNLGELTKESASAILIQMGLENQIPKLDKPSLYGGTTIGQIFWHILDEYLQPQRGKNGVWNTLFKKVGYDGVIDPNISAIHSNEPEQTIVFNPNMLTVLDMIQKSISTNNKSVIYNIVIELANVLFGKNNYTFKTTSDNYKRRRYTAKGYKYNYLFEISINSESYNISNIDYYKDLHLHVYLTSLSTKERLFTEEYLKLTLDDSIYIKERLIPIIDQFERFINKMVKNESSVNNNKLQEIANQVFYYFGLKAPIAKKEDKDIEKTQSYNWGSFRINISKNSLEDDYYARMNLLTIKKEQKKDLRSLYNGNHILYSKPTTTFPEQTPTEEIAKSMIKEMLESLQSEIYNHYHPDPNQHKNDYTRYEYSSTGQNFLRILNRIKSIPRIRTLIGFISPEDETQKEIQNHRNEIDFKEYLKGFYKRYASLKPLNSNIGYNSYIDQEYQISPSSDRVVVGNNFFKLTKEDKDYLIAKLMLINLFLTYRISPKFLDQNIPEDQPLPFNSNSKLEALATCFAEFFIKHNSLDHLPFWKNLVQLIFAKTLT